MAIIRNATVISVTSNTATVYIDEDGQSPATSVTVYLYTNNSHSGTAAATSITDSAGNATFTGLTPQTTYWVYEANLTTYPSLTTTPAIVQLQNKNGDNIYPVTLDSRKATIAMTDVDPGEGAALQENHFIAVYGDAAKIRTDDIAGGAVTSDKIDWTTISLGETYALTSNIPSLPYTAYNGTNVLCSTGSQSFSGGTYILMMSSVSCYFTSINYQGFFAYRIDNGDWVQTDNWAQWGNGGSAGERSFMTPINISKGTHTIYIGFGTNSGDKSMVISQYQELGKVAHITKVGG